MKILKEKIVTHTEKEVHIAAFRNSDEYVSLTKDINKYGTERNNELFNKIALNSSEMKTQNKYVTVDTFARALKWNIKFDSPREISKAKTFLIEFFNELIGIQKEKYNTDNIAFHSNTFIGYIALASIF